MGMLGVWKWVSVPIKSFGWARRFYRHPFDRHALSPSKEAMSRVQRVGRLCVV